MAMQWVSSFRPAGTTKSVAAGHECAEAGRQVSRDGSGNAVADRATVQFGDRHDCGRRAGQEDLLGGVQVVAVHGHFFDGVAGVATQLDDRVAGDAGYAIEEVPMNRSE